MMINVDIPFSFGQIVFLKTDIEQLPRQVIAVKISADNSVNVMLSQGEDIDWHFLVEISAEVNEAMMEDFDLD